MQRSSSRERGSRRLCWGSGVCLVLSAWGAIAQQHDAPAPPQANPQQAPAAAATEPKFDILEFRVLGNSKLKNSEIETAVYPFLGPEKSLRDVESAKHALEDLYHSRGFGTVFVDIPEQQVDNGVVRLHVAE